MKKSLLVVAGEASGDMHAAAVLAELKKRNPDIHCWGIGGDKLLEQGMRLIYHAKKMDVLGFVEVIKRYPFFKKVFNELLTKVDREKPDAALLIDYPGFNLRLAKELKQRGIKVLYYICPQVWAWKKDRIPLMAETIDRLMVIFPFEVDVFKDVDLTVDFVGHPMLKELREARTAKSQDLPWGEGKKIALLPGSREQEIRHILPGLLRTALQMEQSRLDVNFLIAVPAQREAMVKRMVQRGKIAPLHCSVVSNCSREVLRQADAALVASGTATLEAALLGCPTVLVYKTNPITYALAKHFIQIKWLGIVNIIAEREIMPERIQHSMRPGELAVTVDPLMEDTPQRDTMIADFETIDGKLGDGDPAARVAQIICEELGLSTVSEEKNVPVVDDPAQKETEPEVEAEPEVETEAEPEVEVEPEIETKPEVETKAKPEAEAKLEVEAEPEVEAEAEVEAEDGLKDSE